MSEFMQVVKNGYKSLGLLLLPEEVIKAYENYKESRDYAKENGMQIEYRPKQVITRRFNRFFDVCIKHKLEPMEVIEQLEPFRSKK